MNSDIELIRKLRYATSSHVASLLEEPKQNTAKRLRRNKQIRHFLHEGRCVFTLEQKPKFVRHELLLADLYVRIRPTTWELINEPGINPDRAYTSEQGFFFLEAENEDGHASIKRLVDKAWRYLGHKGRVHFDVPTERQARALCKALLDEGIRHRGKFWISWRGNEAISPNGLTYQLRSYPGTQETRNEVSTAGLSV